MGRWGRGYVCFSLSGNRLFCLTTYSKNCKNEWATCTNKHVGVTCLEVSRVLQSDNFVYIAYSSERGYNAMSMHWTIAVLSLLLYEHTVVEGMVWSTAARIVNCSHGLPMYRYKTATFQCGQTAHLYRKYIYNSSAVHVGIAVYIYGRFLLCHWLVCHHGFDVRKYGAKYQATILTLVNIITRYILLLYVG